MSTQLVYCIQLKISSLSKPGLGWKETITHGKHNPKKFRMLAYVESQTTSEEELSNGTILSLVNF
jgi:hypothetical protein